MIITVENLFYDADSYIECWLTNIRLRKSRVVFIKCAGEQYIPEIAKEFRKRGWLLTQR